MPLHWTDGNILYFPPEGKSEAATQVVNEATWRQYHITRTYLNTRTFSRKEADQKTSALQKQEEQEAGESTDTSDLPMNGRWQPCGKSPRRSPRIQTKPPSAPKLSVPIARRKLLPKPPPSRFMLNKVNKKSRLCQSPTASEEEKEGPSWEQLSTHGIRKKRKSQPMTTATPTAVFPETQKISVTSPGVQPTQQSVTVATPATSRQKCNPLHDMRSARSFVYDGVRDRK